MDTHQLRGDAAPALITGFEPYGGRSVNPSARLAQALDGERVAGRGIVGRTLPVTLTGLAERLSLVLDDVRPAFVIALGLSPGEPMIRLERFGVNLADFDIPDNAGSRLEDMPIHPDGATAIAATLPLRTIQRALLMEGIPARLSATAGTYLCNATLYHLLAASHGRANPPPCGFIHLPYLPEQVAEMLVRAREGKLELQQRADLASMDEATMTRALRIAIATTEAAVAAARSA